jgi:hypothetical protein
MNRQKGRKKCKKCGRLFKPQGLPKHEKTCKGKKRGRKPKKKVANGLLQNKFNSMKNNIEEHYGLRSSICDMSLIESRIALLLIADGESLEDAILFIEDYKQEDVEDEQ